MPDSKEIYLAGKIDSNEGKISEFSDELESRGHEVLEKWWEKGRLPKPYMEHPDTSSPAAEAMIDAAYDSDVFILFAGNRILGAAVELGSAIASLKEKKEKEIIVVNPFETRQSVFYAHPGIIAVNGLMQVRERDWF